MTVESKANEGGERIQDRPEAKDLNPQAELEQAEALAEQQQDLIQALEQRIQQAEQKAEDNWQQLLRVQAELANIRKRAERDVEQAHKYALERFCNELLPVVDNLERALDSAGSVEQSQDMLQALQEGVELTLRSFLDVLKKFQIEQIDPQGEPFNPSYHEAISIQISDELVPNSVMAVLQKGYSLNGRLVRPARVIVSKKAN